MSVEMPDSPPSPESPPAAIDRRSRLDRAMGAIHHALDVLENEDLSKLDGDQKRTLVGAVRYAHDHVLTHQNEKARAESLALGVFCTVLSTASGIALGHMLTKPNEPRAGWARDALRGLSPEHKAAGLTALKQLMAMVEQWVSAQETPEEPTTAAVPESMRTCGTAGPADTVEGAMWETCQSPVEFIVEVSKFGNRGHVQRVCCSKHKDYIVGGAADAKVTRIAPPPAPDPAAS